MAGGVVTRAAALVQGGVLSLALLMPALADGQTRPIDGHTFNPPPRKITLSVASDLLYDTNVAHGTETAARLRDIEPEDVRSTNVAAIDLALPAGRAAFTFLGVVGYDAYARNDQLDRERIDLSAGTKLPLAFCMFDDDLHYARAQSDLADLSLVPNAPAEAAANARTDRRADARLACGPAIGIRPFVSLGHTETTNSAAARRFQDVSETRYAAGLSYANPVVGVVSLVARRASFDYDRRPPDGSLGSQRFRVSYAGVGFDRRLGARLQMTASLGYAWMGEHDARSGRRLNGLNWDLASTVRLADRAQLTVRTSRAIDAATGTFANLVRTSSYAGTIIYALGPSVRVDATASLMTRAFDAGALPQPFQLIDDRSQDYVLGLEYRRARARVRLAAAYRQRDATPDLYDYSGFLLSLGVRYALER